jgi:hypothetical protein
MTKVTYEVVEHDEGYAYRAGDVFSETYPTPEAARAAAEQAAQRQTLTGTDEIIQYQDSQGGWREEFADGENRPETGIVDELTDHPPHGAHLRQKPQ